MAEDNDQSNKTEEATPRKLDEARRKGDVAKTQDLPAFLSLAAVCGVLVASGPLATGLTEALVPFVAAPHELIGALETGAGGEIFRQALLAVLPIMGLVGLAAMVAGVMGNVVQTGFLFASEKLKPQWERVNPQKGFERIFGPDGLVHFVKTLIKVILTGFVAWQVLAPRVHELAQAAAMSPLTMGLLARELLIALAISVLSFTAVAAALDWLWQRWRFAQKMKMSREELKEDFKQTEGDPHVKARLRQIRMEKARQRMMANVPKATVVITNPTHFAVALRYAPEESGAPICVAKGVDAVALRIREVAGDHDVPIVENPPLARALYATVDVDEVIPREHFEAVAKVIGFVMSGAARRGRRYLD